MRDVVILPARVVTLLNSLAVGGAESSAINCVLTLDRRHFQSSVCTLRGPDTLLPRLEGSHVSVHSLCTRSPLEIARFLRKCRADIVQTHHTLAGALGRVAARLARTPIVVSTEQNVVDALPLRYRALNDATIHLGDANVCISEGVRESLMREGVFTRRLPPARVTVIPNGVDLPAIDARLEGGRNRTRAALGIGAEDFVIGNVGRLVPQKGQRFLIQAFAAVVSEIPRARLVIVGGGRLAADLRKVAAQLNVSPRVHLLGERTDAIDLMAAFDVFALPSDYEGLGVVLLEALAARVPVIATDVPGVRDVVEHGVTGVLVPPRSPGQLAEELLALAAAPDRRRELAEVGRRRIEDKFTVEAVARSYGALYDRLLAAKGVTSAKPHRDESARPA